ncbi:hypothetical protein FQZ97_912420 [compost metagenome]
MVVPVLITSCHVSEKPKNGPATAQATTTTTQTRKAAGLPVQRATVLAKESKSRSMRVSSSRGDAAATVRVGASADARLAWHRNSPEAVGAWRHAAVASDTAYTRRRVETTGRLPHRVDHEGSLQSFFLNPALASATGLQGATTHGQRYPGNHRGRGVQRSGDRRSERPSGEHARRRVRLSRLREGSRLGATEAGVRKPRFAMRQRGVRTRRTHPPTRRQTRRRRHGQRCRASRLGACEGRGWREQPAVDA